jgi:hypothetical protein
LVLPARLGLEIINPTWRQAGFIKKKYNKTQAQAAATAANEKQNESSMLVRIPRLLPEGEIAPARQQAGVGPADLREQ